MQNRLASALSHSPLIRIRSGGVSSAEQHLFSISFWHFLTRVFLSFSSAFQGQTPLTEAPALIVLGFFFPLSAHRPLSSLAEGTVWLWCYWCCHAIQLSNDASSFKRLTACENFISMRNVCFLLAFVFTAINNLWTTSNRSLGSKTDSICSSITAMIRSEVYFYWPVRDQFGFQNIKSQRKNQMCPGAYFRKRDFKTWS